MTDIWNTLPSQETVDTTLKNLAINGFNPLIVQNGEEAKQKVLQMLPKGAEVFNATSVTLDTISVSQAINESGNYQSVRNELMKLDRTTQSLQMQKLGAAPEWMVGSVHAVTQDGHVVIASRSGSQIPGYVYGAGHVIWVVGAQKIVKDVDEAIKRIYEHVLPLESERVKKAYGMEHSDVAKLLILNEEFTPDRIHLILVNQIVGF